MQKKVSVIVPVYNVERYLGKCIDSVLEQSLKEIEILLIDDGSTDSSRSICENYSRKDNRVKFFSKKNGGLSDARNYGMKYISGQYTIFIDSDDWIEKDMLLDMYTLAQKQSADVVVSGAIIDFENENYLMENNVDKIYSTKNNDSISEIIFKLCESDLFNIVWNKLYKSKVIENYKFIEDAMPAEDIIFNSQLFENVSSVLVIDKSYYHYMKRDIVSYVTKYSPKMYKVAMNRYESFANLFSSKNLNSKKHKLWLDKLYIEGIQDCLINMYRSGSVLTVKMKIDFIKNVILEDSHLLKIIDNYTPTSLIGKIFKNVYKTKNTFFILFTYETLFLFKNKFSKLYLLIRKRQNSVN